MESCGAIRCPACDLSFTTATRIIVLLPIVIVVESIDDRMVAGAAAAVDALQRAMTVAAIFVDIFI